jgi:hypothetical protein
MLLTTRNLTDYLMEAGLLDPEMVMEDLTITSAASRSRNFKVRFGSGGLFVKQISSWTPPSMQFLAREAECYRLARDKPEFGSLADIAPVLIRYDLERHILIVKLLSDAENLTEHHTRVGTFSASIGRTLGQALGSYHRNLGPETSLLFEANSMPRQAPWILSLGRTQTMEHPSSGAKAMARIVEDYPEFVEKLSEVGRDWRVDALIHGDMKWHNCMVSVSAPERTLKIVDWELADLGDARWDVGGIFQAYLSFWALSLRGAPSDPTEVLAASGPYSLDAMLPAMHAFWGAYTERMALEPKKTAEWLTTSLRYAAARMVQTAYELSAGTGALTTEAVRLLQISFNMLDRPGDAARDLFGFSL